MSASSNSADSSGSSQNLHIYRENDRRLKVLQFDRYGKALFGLCEPSVSADKSAAAAVATAEESDGTKKTVGGIIPTKRLDLIRLSVYGTEVTVCKRLVFQCQLPESNCTGQDLNSCTGQNLNNNPTESIDNKFACQRPKVKDVAYGASQLGDKFAVIHRVEFFNAGKKLEKYYFVIIDLENDCQSTVYEFESDYKIRRNAEVKILHLSNGVGWALVELSLDNAAGCEILTYYSMTFDRHVTSGRDSGTETGFGSIETGSCTVGTGSRTGSSTGTVKLCEKMRYSTEEYFVALTATGSKIYIFEVGSTDVTIYDALEDAFLCSVQIPVYSYHIFNVDDQLYLYPQRWHDHLLPKNSPKCLFKYDYANKKWRETDLIVPAPDKMSALVKDVWITGSKAGYIAVGSSRPATNRTTPTNQNARAAAAGGSMTSPSSSFVNYYHVYRLPADQSKTRSARSLKELAFCQASKHFTTEQICAYGLPPNVFREYFGPQWQQRKDDDQSMKTIVLC